MKNLSFIFLVIMCLMMAGSSVFAEQYYCPTGSGFSSADFYDPGKDCSSLNTEYFRKYRPNEYAQCIQDYKLAQKRYQEGHCDPVSVINHNFENATCVVKVSKKFRRFLGSECRGPESEIDKSIQLINRLYQDWNQ